MKNQKKFGQLFVLLAGLILFSPSFSYSQFLAPGDSLVVVDGNQKVIGEIVDGIGFGVGGHVFFEQDPFLISLQILKNQVRTKFLALFESNDCSGLPLIDAEGKFGNPLNRELFSPATIVSDINPNQDNLGILYVVDPNSLPHTVMIQSFKDDNPGCNPNITDQIQVVDTIQVMDLDSNFTAPFHLEVIRGTNQNQLQEEIDELESLITDQSIKLLNHYHKLKLGRRLRLPTGPPIFSDEPHNFPYRFKKSHYFSNRS